jgi:SsrA-binding protein
MQITMNLAQNKKARFDYEILKEFEAGIELHGFEVKSARAGRGTLRGAHVVVRGGEAYLVGCTIPPYQTENTPKTYDPERPRRLLLHKKELYALEDAESQKGLTVIALSLYNKNRKLKVSVAIARGKKKHDKREVIKKRDTERDLQRSLKR